MKPLDRLSEYLGAIERRLRLIALTRGAAVTAAAALLLDRRLASRRGVTATTA